ncbi:hypothetical protein HDV00_002774 [Rhizophlyctis rosea]|nr:hypothetical protein HDV00_002774 [Rhizophlyctis rosea]
MFFKSTALSVLALFASANAHYHIANIDGQTNCLRPLVPNGGQNNPVTGDAISSSAIMCGANSASANPAAAKCTYAAGSTLTAQYDPNGAWHIGPCYAYISSDNGKSWAKIFQDYKKTSAGWCNDRWLANDKKLSFTIPPQLPSGNYVIRIESIAIHNAQSAGGAQIYVTCADLTITGGGSTPPSPLTTFPGAYGPSTPGIQWNPYSGDQSLYPAVGPALAYSGSSGGGSSNP